MKRLLLACALVLAGVASALAVPVTFTVGGSTFSTTITGPNAQRGLAWATAAYPTIPNPSYDPNKPTDPVTNPQTLPNPDPVKSALAAIWQGIIANVQSSEKATAQKAIVEPAPVN